MPHKSLLAKGKELQYMKGKRINGKRTGPLSCVITKNNDQAAKGIKYIYYVAAV